MEMNTRLQVEHPVTEAITGLDLVEWQLRVASGEPLPLRQDQLRIQGHAIEARICAENPDNNFLPATGTLQVYRKPACTSFAVAAGAVRVDDGVREGDTISPYYDSMVAKLIVHGDTREQALALLDQALAQTQVVGLSTNVQFLRHVVSSPSFAQARLDTVVQPRKAGLECGRSCCCGEHAASRKYAAEPRPLWQKRWLAIACRNGASFSIGVCRRQPCGMVALLTRRLNASDMGRCGWPRHDNRRRCV
jgi:acetyl/propionyl-CoA carboxylase alpha subunit